MYKTMRVSILKQEIKLRITADKKITHFTSAGHDSWRANLSLLLGQSKLCKHVEHQLFISKIFKLEGSIHGILSDLANKHRYILILILISIFLKDKNRRKGTKLSNFVER